MDITEWHVVAWLSYSRCCRRWWFNSLHLSNDLAVPQGQHVKVIRDLFVHYAGIEFVAGFLEEISEMSKVVKMQLQKECRSATKRVLPLYKREMNRRLEVKSI